MKEPRRLLSHGATDFERQLLRAVSNERPSALLRSRMQRGLGLVGPLAWASNVKAMFGSMASKLAGSVALGGIIAVGGVAAVFLIPSSNPEPSAAERPSIEQPSSSNPAPQGELPALEAAPPSPAPAAVDPVGAEPAPSVAAPSEAEPSALDDASADGQLREEIALIDTARAALQAGHRDAAREQLRAYRERFPDGILRREAKVLARRAEPKRAKR